jgi:uncharacterized protein involved in outer membrane biogenesis
MKRTFLILVGLWALVLVLALVGPALINWSRYKEVIATRLEQATGRDVDIAGPVSLRLLPAPAFSADQVTIGNLPGGGDQPVATVERLDIRLRWLPLLTGTVEITSLDLDRPILHLARLADGRANWEFSPPATAPEADANPPQTGPSPAGPSPAGPPSQARPTLKGEPPPTERHDDISIDRASIRDGAITYRSGDDKPIRFGAIDATIAIGGAKGPFSADGIATHSGTPVRFEIAIDRISPGRGSPISAALSLPDGAARLDFTGILSALSAGETLNGRMTIAAPDAARALATLGITTAPAPLAAPLAAETSLTIARDDVTAKDLVINLGDTRIAGTVTAALGDTPQIDADLRLATLDLDKWAAAAPAKAEPIAAAPPSGSNGNATSSAPPPQPDKAVGLPATLFAHLTLVAETVAWRGEVVRDAHFDATLAEGEIAVHRVSGQLPGGSTLSGEGSVSAAKGQPVFDGVIKLGSDNPRALLAWLGADIAALPPGRLSLATPLTINWPALSLTDFRLTMGDESLRGRVKARLEQPLAFDLAADTGKWGAVTAIGTLAGTALDAKLQAFGLDAAVKGSLGDRPDLAISAHHPDTARLLRQFAAGYRPRGPLGGLTLNAQVTGADRVWTIGGLNIEAGAIRLTGSARADLTAAKPTITAELNGNDLALDPFLAAERTGFLLPGGFRLPPIPAPPPMAVLPAATVPGGAGEPPWSREPLDLAALQGFNARMALNAKSVSAKGWRLDNAAAKLAVQDGGAAIEHLTGKLLGGDFTALARLTGGTVPGLSGQVSVAGADIGAVKPKAGDFTVTQGRLDAETRFTTHGRSSFDMASRLAGDGRLLIKDGIVTGFDLAAVNQRLNNLENVGSLLGLVQSGMTGGSTRFTALTGTVQAKDGIVTTRDLKLDAQGGGATADSTTDLARWTTATTIAIRLADSTAPPLLVRLEGPLGNPRKIIDINALQQHLVARGLGRALKGKDGGLVETLLGGKRAPPPEGSQAPPSDQPAEKPNGARVLRDLLKGLGGR